MGTHVNGWCVRGCQIKSNQIKIQIYALVVGAHMSCTTPSFLPFASLLACFPQVCVDVTAPPPQHTSITDMFTQVVDSAGNAASFVQSNYMHFGTGIVPEVMVRFIESLLVK